LLRDKLKNKKLSAKELSQTVELILERFGKIKDFEIYIDIILRMIHHPKVNKDIVISFEKRLSKLNPDYAETIAHNVTLALNSRRY
jgi:uncharacterized protein YktB (UPF0637 family)